jgi:hypothetical protein
MYCRSMRVDVDPTVEASATRLHTAYVSYVSHATGHSILDTAYWTQHTGHSILDTAYAATRLHTAYSPILRIFLSLSLYIYLYLHMYVCVCVLFRGTLWISLSLSLSLSRCSRVLVWHLISVVALTYLSYLTNGGRKKIKSSEIE